MPADEEGFPGFNFWLKLLRCGADDLTFVKVV